MPRKSAIKIVHSDVQIQGFILDVLGSEIKRFLRRSATQVKRKVRALFKERFLSSPTYSSLVSGDLWHEFGLVDPQGYLGDILEHLLDFITVDVNFTKTNPRRAVATIAGFELHLLDLSFEEILNLPASKQVTEKGDVLEWLDWLLLQGNKTIIKDYQYKGVYSPYSRSGFGLMFEDGRWKVPAQYAGTRNNNFLTDIIDGMDEEIAQIVQDEIEA